MQLESGRKPGTGLRRSPLALDPAADPLDVLERQRVPVAFRDCHHETPFPDKLDRGDGGLELDDAVAQPDLELHSGLQAGVTPDLLRNDQPSGAIDGGSRTTYCTTNNGTDASPVQKRPRPVHARSQAHPSASPPATARLPVARFLV